MHLHVVSPHVDSDISDTKERRDGPEGRSTTESVFRNKQKMRSEDGAERKCDSFPKRTRETFYHTLKPTVGEAEGRVAKVIIGKAPDEIGPPAIVRHGMRSNHRECGKP